MSYKANKALRILIIVIVISITVLITAEIGLRLYNQYNPLFIHTYDNYYCRSRAVPFMKAYDFTCNSLGFKDLEFSKEKNGNFRIVVIGDSTAYGIIPYKYNCITLLENRLKQKYNSLEIYNMGIPGIGPHDYVSLFLNEGIQYDPDLVIMTATIVDDFIQSSEARRRSVTKFYIALFIRQVLDIRPSYKGILNYGSSVYNDKQPTFTIDKYIEKEGSKIHTYKNDEEHFRNMLNDTIHYIGLIKSICDTKGAKLLITVIPAEIQIDPELRADVIKSLNHDPVDYDVCLPNKMLTDKLRAMGIKYFDLYESFLIASKKRKLFKPRDTHWNIAGNRLTAEKLYDYMKCNIDFMPTK